MAYQTTEDERRVIDWLRSQAEGFDATAQEALKKGDRQSARDRFGGKVTCLRAATAIELGEHRND